MLDHRDADRDHAAAFTQPAGAFDFAERGAAGQAPTGLCFGSFNLGLIRIAEVDPHRLVAPGTDMARIFVQHPAPMPRGPQSVIPLRMPLCAEPIWTSALKLLKQNQAGVTIGRKSASALIPGQRTERSI